ncbi:unnamed protein product [Thelazia callipaeda]|uniref:Hflx-type G domain-containing protein n=1 Tax=Thelazia callipaeda TaxID=103827 RepID=A0A0N5CZY3_THECL|nr:unnamed protein product [Thelazia callipaeda]
MQSVRNLCIKQSEEVVKMNDEFNIISKSYGVRDVLPGCHRVLLIHPRLRRGRFFDLNPTKIKLQLEEATALVNTLPNFRVIQTVCVNTDRSTEKKRLWGEGRIERVISLKEEIAATALMIDVKILSPRQQVELSEIFRVPVYDRYNIVLLIFKMFAKTKEAKLQIQLAEIPYISLSVNVALKCIFREEKLEILRYREHHLRKCLKAAVEEKVNLRIGEARKNIRTVVAVVGYTNAGKSSLIKRLTGRDLYVEDRLFATLDTSLHLYRLPSGLPILFADTIGFISNLPSELLASFQATLNHVSNADLLLHVEDVSNPDYLAQRDVVLKTLLALRIRNDLIESMIRVGNKIDKLDQLPADESNTYFVSCTDGRGLVELLTAVDKRVLQMRGAVIRRLKLRPHSKAIPYLYKYSFIVGQPTPSEDNNYLLCNLQESETHFRDIMPLIALQLKANMVNLTELQPAGDWTKFRWHLKIYKFYPISVMMMERTKIPRNLVEIFNKLKSNVTFGTFIFISYIYSLQFKCTNCGEESKNWKYITEKYLYFEIFKDRYEVSGNRGTANLFEKCKLCARMNSVEIVKDSLQPYTDIGNFETLVKFDCRGLEPIAFEPRVRWKAVSTKSSLVFEDVDLIDKEWVDYDEKAAEPVEISEMDCRFVLCRKE